MIWTYLNIPQKQKHQKPSPKKSTAIERDPFINHLDSCKGYAPVASWEINGNGRFFVIAIFEESLEGHIFNDIYIYSKVW